MRSIHPAMGNLVDRGVSPGADFFDDSSADDDSAWEDDNGTRDFSEVEGLGIRDSVVVADSNGHRDEWEGEETRGRQRRSGFMKALPPFNQIAAHESGIGIVDDGVGSSLQHENENGQARKMSLRRMGKVRLVHNPRSVSTGRDSLGRGTPCDSVVSNDSADVSSTSEIPKPPPFPYPRAGDGGVDAVRSGSLPRRQPGNTSESIRADCILNAYVMTLQALDAAAPDATLSRSPTTHMRSRSHPDIISVSPQRHITLSALCTQDGDSDRPPHLPPHFIKMPYPFSAKKEFPKPKTRPRQRVDDPGPVSFGSKKGRQVLGIAASDGEYDTRSRLARNEEAQGVVRPRSDCALGRTRWVSRRSAVESIKESVVWLSLRKHSARVEGVASSLAQIVVPSSLTTTSPRPGCRRRRHGLGSHPNKLPGNDATVDFDDMLFAQHLRDAYARLAGPWFLRALSPRTLSYIQLDRVAVWSGSSPPHDNPSNKAVAARLLAARGTLEADPESRTPFSEENLMALYRNPASGKARYTWVHWARRVAASNGMLNGRLGSSGRLVRIKPVDFDAKDEEEYKASAVFSSPRGHAKALRDYLTTVQFVHAFSALKILVVAGLMLALSVLAALLWVFEGKSVMVVAPEGRSRAERVGPGMLVGLMALGVEGVLFAVWVLGSWAWL